MNRLNSRSLAALPVEIGRPRYDRQALSTGIVHFGPGAFHRAHQAAYVDGLLEHDPRWAIAAVSLRSPRTVEALERQEGLYTLAVLDREPSFRILGAHNRFVGPDRPRAVRGLLAEPGVRIVSSTVTEKGYCLAGDGALDFDHPDIVHDLSRPDEPQSLVGWLTLGLRDRRDSRAAPFTPLCCDNMVANGKKLREAVVAFSSRLDPSLGRWIGQEVRFPATMVDSITPAADDGLRARVREATGLEDEAPVAREDYAAWIIEDVLPTDGPDLASVGAVLTGDVGGYELAKLRILNGAHSSLAYIGLLRGHETVADAMGDRSLVGFVTAMIAEDIIPTLRARASMDLEVYAGEILARFRNPAIHHKLSQIAWDGSQKLPYRLLDTIAEARGAGRQIDRLAIPVAAWMAFVQRQVRRGKMIADPLADRLAGIANSAVDAEALVAAFLELHEVFPSLLAGDMAFREALESALESLLGEVHA